ncbi:MAG: hypothetical protein RLZZ243_1732, partial [Bacteroidota bacterium]
FRLSSEGGQDKRMPIRMFRRGKSMKAQQL